MRARTARPRSPPAPVTTILMPVLPRPEGRSRPGPRAPLRDRRGAPRYQETVWANASSNPHSGRQPSAARRSERTPYRKSCPGLSTTNSIRSVGRLGELADAARELEIRQLVTLTDVVHDPGLAPVEGRQRAPHPVLDVEELASLLAPAVDRHRQAPQRIHGERRHDALDLSRAEGVRAPDHDDGQVDRSRRTRRTTDRRRPCWPRTGCAGRTGASSSNRPAAASPGPVHLVGGDHQHAGPVTSRRLEHGLGAEHVRRQERRGLVDAAVDVRLGGRVHDRVGLVDEAVDAQRRTRRPARTVIRGSPRGLARCSRGCRLPRGDRAP